MAESVPRDVERPPHFIGWLPMPREYTRFLAPVAIGLVLGAVVAAGVIARGQRSPGDGRWDSGVLTTFEGVAYAEPYAMIRVKGSDPAIPPFTVLLVGQGKSGAQELLRPFDGQPARVTGTLVSRNGWRMLEIATGGLRSTDLPGSELARLRRPPPRSLERTILCGEIVDSKCYLGAMKPGGGWTHRGCAALCLRGGIPPLFVTRSAGGQDRLYLLTSETGGHLSPEILDHCGCRVELHGRLEEWGDLAVLAVRSCRDSCSTE